MDFQTDVVSFKDESVFWAGFDCLIHCFQICSQLSERLEKQQTANKEELQRIKVKLP